MFGAKDRMTDLSTLESDLSAQVAAASDVAGLEAVRVAALGNGEPRSLPAPCGARVTRPGDGGSHGGGGWVESQALGCGSGYSFRLLCACW